MKKRITDLQLPKNANGEGNKNRTTTREWYFFV